MTVGRERDGGNGTIELIEYTIVSIEPTRERILPDGCRRRVLLTGELGRCDLETYLVADYLESHRPATPAKFLRVAHRVIGRWPRPSLRYRPRQLRSLAAIEAAIRSSVGGDPSAAAESPSPPSPPPSRPPGAALRRLLSPPPAPSTPPVPPAAPSAPAGPPEAPPEPDDLTRISGIGPAVSEVLVAAGVTTFRELAETPVEDLVELLRGAGSRFRLADPSGWPEAARDRGGDG